MAPSQQYDKDEKVLCFHHEMLYEAKVLDARQEDKNDKKSGYQYLVHYKGWKNTYVFVDAVVPLCRNLPRSISSSLQLHLRSLHL